MPKFEVSIEGKQYRVEIPDPGASPLRVIVDGQAFDVGIIGSETQAKPAVEAPPPVTEPAPLPHPPRLAAGGRPVIQAGASSDHEVTAPLPGTVLSVEVTPGQLVELGQVVCILEAMKMKNQIRATVTGTVSDVLVQGGQTVAYGDVLIRLA